MTADPAVAERLAGLRDATMPLGGSAHRVVLDPPRCAAVAGLIVDAPRRAGHERALLRAELAQTVTLDGQPVWADQADRIIDDPQALAAFRTGRDQLYAFVVEQGRALAICPTCSAEVELDLAFYAVALRLPPWRVSDGSFLAAPRLAHPEPFQDDTLIRPSAEPLVAVRPRAPRPSGPPLAARIDFQLPSARIGVVAGDDAVGGSLGDVVPAEEAQAWRRWACPERDQPDERAYWRPSSAGFRALLRLSVALTRLLDSASDPMPATPETAERLFLPDLLFLDALYTATHELPVPSAGAGGEPRGTVRCASGHRFLPVR